MKERLIKFSGMQDAKQFITQADKCDFDIDVSYNHIILDGKSIMALLSLDFSKPITVKYNGENPTFESVLTSLSAK